MCRSGRFLLPQHQVGPAWSEARSPTVQHYLSLQHKHANSGIAAGNLMPDVLHA